MTPDLSATLRSVAEVMASFTDGWWIIGSAAIALHGVDAGPVHDVDVLVDAKLASAVLEKLGVAPLDLPPDPLFRSMAFARWDMPPVPVEIMAGLHVAVAGQWRPVELHSRVLIVIEGAALFVPDRQELLGLFRLFGRPKDGRRIQALVAAGATTLPAAPAP